MVNARWDSARFTSPVTSGVTSSWLLACGNSLENTAEAAASHRQRLAVLGVKTKT